MLKYEIKAILATANTPYSVKDIAAMLNRRLSHETGPSIRKAIRDLIEEGSPIGSGPDGYFWIKRKDQLDACLSGLQSRCDALQKRIVMITKAYNGERNRRHLDSSLSLRDRCRFYVIYLAEECNIPYQAVWALAYRKFTKLTGVDTINLPTWYSGSTLNYISNQGLAEQLYVSLCRLERGLM